MIFFLFFQIFMVLPYLHGGELITYARGNEVIDIDRLAPTDVMFYQTSSAFTYSAAQIKDRVNRTILLADIFGARLDKISDLFKTSVREPAVRNTSFANLVSTKYMGIPESADIAKRQVATELLHKDSALGGVYFTLANGDVYLGEPYADQAQLPRLNYADRDWYKGVSSTNETYISSAFMSASTRAPKAAIALPVYDTDRKTTLLGYWLGLINIKMICKDIKDVYLPEGQELIVTDHHGTEMYNSGKYNYSKILTFPVISQNDSKIIGTIANATLRELDGNVVAISYPVVVNSHVWNITTIK